jgi:hypothetical protein
MVKRLEKARLGEADHCDQHDQRDEDAGLLGGSEPRLRRCAIFIGTDEGRPDELVRCPSLQSLAYLGRLLAGVDQMEEGAIVDAASGDFSDQPAAIENQNPVAKADQFQ